MNAIEFQEQVNKSPLTAIMRQAIEEGAADIHIKANRLLSIGLQPHALWSSLRHCCLYWTA